MIRTLRATSRILRVSFFLGAFTIRMRMSRPAEHSPDYEAWRRRYFGGACRGILDRLGVRIEADGEFPNGGGVLVTNHLGYLDVLVLGSLGPAVFVSRADVESWPLIGPLTRWCSTIYIERARRDQIPAVIREMSAALEQGAQVIFFPEGTSGAGDRVMPFRPSLFDAALAGGAPVRVAALTYSTGPGDPPARDAICWWGDAGFVRHFTGLAGLRGIRARVRFAPAPVQAGDRKELARRCETAVSVLFTPVDQCERDR